MFANDQQGLVVQSHQDAAAKETLDLNPNSYLIVVITMPD
jgi:hypothetical protein